MGYLRVFSSLAALFVLTSLLCTLAGLAGALSPVLLLLFPPAVIGVLVTADQL